MDLAGFHGVDDQGCRQEIVGVILDWRIDDRLRVHPTQTANFFQAFLGLNLVSSQREGFLFEEILDEIKHRSLLSPVQRQVLRLELLPQVPQVVQMVPERLLGLEQVLRP